MIDIGQLFGQPAVSLADAERTGTVKGLRFEGNRIVAIDIGDGRTIPADSVRTFEGDALTYEYDAAATDRQVDDLADAEPLDSSRDTDHPSSADLDVLAGELPRPGPVARRPWSGDPIGTLLLSDAGDALGKLSTMHVGPDGVVLEMADDRGHTYRGDRLLAVGSFATIVTAADDDQI